MLFARWAVKERTYRARDEFTRGLPFLVFQARLGGRRGHPSCCAVDLNHFSALASVFSSLLPALSSICLTTSLFSLFFSSNFSFCFFFSSLTILSIQCRKHNNYLCTIPLLCINKNILFCLHIFVLFHLLSSQDDFLLD